MFHELKDDIIESLPDNIKGSFFLNIEKSSVWFANEEQVYENREADRQLVLAAQESSGEFKALYEKYKDKIYDYFKYRLGSEFHIIDDLMQETFLRAFKYLHHFTPGKTTYFTYLQRIAHNLLVNYYRKAKPIPLEEVYNLIDENKQDVDLTLGKEKLWEKAKNLSGVEQDILEMRYKEGMSVLEISMILQKSENAVKLHLSRARGKLRGLLG